MTIYLNWIILIILFLIPLLGAFGTFGYEHIKVLAFVVLTSIAGVLWFIELRRGNLKFDATSLIRLSTLFVIILTFSAIFGINLNNSFFGSPPYFQGLLLYLYLLLFSWIVATSKLRLEQIAITLSFSSALVSIFAIRDWAMLHILGQIVPTYAGRVVSTFGQPNLYSGFLLLTLPFYIYLAAKCQKQKVWIYLGMVVLILAIFVSYSRVATILLLGLALTWLYFKLSGKQKILALLLAAFLAIIFALAKSDYLLTTAKKELGLGDQVAVSWYEEYSPQRRVYIWPVILDLIAQKPLMGYGLDNLLPVFSSRIKLEEAKTPVAADLKNLPVDRSHNYILDLLVFSGILGLLSWVLLIRQMVMTTKDKFILTSLVLYLIWTQIQIQSVIHLIFFWIMVGLISQEKSNAT